MVDMLVLQIQQWLNKTYGIVAGFGEAPKDGRTGLDTIYGLIKGLQ